VQALLNAQADIEGRDSNGYTALMSMVSEKQQDCVQFLIDSKANIEARDQMDSTSLCIAAGAGRVESTRVLIAAKADLEARTTNGYYFISLLRVSKY